jgi:hypothetical protein
VKISINTGLLLQIVLGATLAALGGTISQDGIGIAITVLGALQALVGGILSYFIARNQPNRARHLTHELQSVLDRIEDADVQFRSGTYVGDGTAGNGREENREMEVEDVVRMLIEAFAVARSDKTRNAPDLWVAEGNKRLGGGKRLGERRPAEPVSWPTVSGRDIT